MRRRGMLFLWLLVLLVLCACAKEMTKSSSIQSEATVAVSWRETETVFPTETIDPTVLGPTATETVETEPKETQPSETGPAAMDVEEKVSVTYSDVDEYAYAKSDVNVRSGAGTKYKKLGCLSKGEVINRIGIGSNGWSREIYKGQDAYISSNYLTKEKPTRETMPSATEAIPEQTEIQTFSTELSTEPTESVTLPEPTDKIELPTDESAEAPTVPSAEPATETPTESPTEPPTEEPLEAVESEKIDASALAAYGNSYASSLGFTVDYGVRDGYFPPDTVAFSTMKAAYSNVAANVKVLYDNIIARNGSVEGYCCCVTVTDNEDGTYTTTVYYG